MRRTLLIACALLAASVRAEPHRLSIHINPSITVLSIAQGADGFLWLATEDGVYRYDGSHYRKLPDYPFGSAKFVAAAPDGSIWFASREGLARYTERFEVILRENVGNLALAGNQALVEIPRGQFAVDARGSLTPAQGLQPQPMRWLTDAAGRVWFRCGIYPAKGACWVDPVAPFARQMLPTALPLTEGQAFRDEKGRLWAAEDHRATYAGAAANTILTRRFSQAVSRLGPLQPGRNGQLWFIGETIFGTNPVLEFRDRQQREQFLPTAGFEDDHGRLWVATNGEGLVEWTIDPEWERWPSDAFGGQPATHVVRTPQGEVIAATHNNLYRLDERTRQWTPIAKGQRRYASVLSLPNGEFLASIREQGLARLSRSGDIVERIPSVAGGPDDFRLVFRDGDGAIWIANRAALMRLEGQSGAYRATPQPLPLIPRINGQPKTPMFEPGMEQAIDLETDREGRLWVGFADGIAWRDDNGEWHRLPTTEPVSAIRSFTLAGDRSGSEIWVALRGQGYFVRLQRSGGEWTVTKFAPENGYGPRDTDFIKGDSRGWIWRGSTDGVYISDGQHVAPGDWLHIGLRTGLATNGTDQYGFFEDTDGSVWIAGEEGVSHLKPDAAWFEAPEGAPSITWLEVGTNTFTRSASLPQHLPGGDIRIEVGSLNAPPFRDAPLRYRLTPIDKDWKLSRDGTLLFRNLPDGDYTLELSYSGAGTPAISTYEFQVGAGGAALTWIWISAIALGGSLWALMRRSQYWRDRIGYKLSKVGFTARRIASGWRAGSSPGVATRAPDLSGEAMLDRYRLLRPIANSSFSVVYEALDMHEDARVAIKVLNASTIDDWVRDRFAQEVTSLQSIRHPGVVPVLDSWIAPNGQPCLAMPLLEGPTLRAEMANGPLYSTRVARLAELMGSALAAVHERGVVHRDLKPENVILTEGKTSEQPVLIDFGTAGLRAGKGELAATTLLAGSFYYMAPERLSGQYSTATDVYSFGVIVLEMLTGKRLADLSVLFAEDAFLQSLTASLAQGIPNDDAARSVADALAEAFDPVPQRRPAADVWSVRIAGLLRMAAL